MHRTGNEKNWIENPSHIIIIIFLWSHIWFPSRLLSVSVAKITFDIFLSVLREYLMVGKSWPEIFFDKDKILRSKISLVMPPPSISLSYRNYAFTSRLLLKLENTTKIKCRTLIFQCSCYFCLCLHRFHRSLATQKKVFSYFCPTFIYLSQIYCHCLVAKLLLVLNCIPEFCGIGGPEKLDSCKCRKFCGKRFLIRDKIMKFDLLRVFWRKSHRNTWGDIPGLPPIFYDNFILIVLLVHILTEFTSFSTFNHNLLTKLHWTTFVFVQVGWKFGQNSQQERFFFVMQYEKHFFDMFLLH